MQDPRVYPGHEAESKARNSENAEEPDEEITASEFTNAIVEIRTNYSEGKEDLFLTGRAGEFGSEPPRLCSSSR